MKKYFIPFLLLFNASVAHAYTITTSPYISGNDVTIAHLETDRTTYTTVLNGGIEGGGVNIKAGTINSVDVAQAISINQFRDEAFNDWTYTGMLPPTSASLSSTTTAGISYVNGVRVSTAATSHTYTASKDTYVFINAGGFFEYSEVANGASAPSTPANDLLLAKVVSSGTAITSVTDLRTTAIQITVNGSNFPADYRNQALVVRDSTTAMHIEPGNIGIGSSFYTTTSDSTSRATSTSSNWIEGNIPTQNNLKFYVYAYNNSGSTFDFKYSSADPVYSDTSSNTGGTLRYYTNGGTTYRAIAWVSADSTGNIQTYNFSNFLEPGSIVNRVTYETGAVATGTASTPLDDTIPQYSETKEFMVVPFRPTNANSTLRIDVVANFANSAGASNDIIGALFQDNGTSAIAVGTQSVIDAGEPIMLCFSHTMTAGTTNVIVFRFGAGSQTGSTLTFNGSAGSRRFGGVIASSITVTEFQN